jgi:tetratricopeptide (TPR) repeat protein
MRYFSFFVVLFFSTMLFQGVAFAAPVDYWFEKANALYEHQNYDSAVVYYKKIISSGTNNGAVCFNLGNSYFRLNKIGLSMLFFEKALRFSPNDPDIIANIKFVQTTIVDRPPTPEQSFVEAVLLRLHHLFSLDAQLWVIFGLLMALGFFFSLGLFISSNVRLWIIYLSTILIVVLVCFGISAGIKIYAHENIPYAIVLSPSVDARNQPNGNKVLFTVHEGTEFRVRKQEGEWSLVSLPTGVSGWVTSSSLGTI